MKVILMGELRGKGGEGDVIDVADGFANNWLFPQKIAIPATSSNLKQLEQRRNNIQKREAARLADATSVKEQLDIEADHKRIDLKPIKTVGAHAVQVSMYRDIAATITVEVNDAAGFAAIDAANAEAEAPEAAEAEVVEEVETAEVAE